MADSLLDKVTSALGEAKETVIASVDTAKTDVVKDAVENVVTKGIDGAKSMLHDLEEKKDKVSSKIFGAISHITGKADSSDTTTTNLDLPVSTDSQVTSALGEAKETDKTDVVKDTVDNVVTKGIDGAKSLLHGLEEKKSEVSSNIFGAISHLTSSADSPATNHDLAVSTDNQPLLAGDRAVETARPWWKSCCGILDLLKATSSSST